jgi:hypothetical protein
VRRFTNHETLDVLAHKANIPESTMQTADFVFQENRRVRVKP